MRITVTPTPDRLSNAIRPYEKRMGLGVMEKLHFPFEDVSEWTITQEVFFENSGFSLSHVNFFRLRALQTADQPAMILITLPFSGNST